MTIFFILGQTGSGKTTICDNIINNCTHKDIEFRMVSQYTTRPKRNMDDNDYTFVCDSVFDELYKHGIISEARTYETSNGIWHYGSAFTQEQQGTVFIVNGPVEMCKSYINKFGSDVIPILITRPEIDRVVSLIKRENSKSTEPDYTELYRRIHSDYVDFSGIDFGYKEFVNTDIMDTTSSVFDYIVQTMGYECNTNTVYKSTSYHSDYDGDIEPISGMIQNNRDIESHIDIENITSACNEFIFDPVNWSSEYITNFINAINTVKSRRPVLYKEFIDSIAPQHVCRCNTNKPVVHNESDSTTVVKKRKRCLSEMLSK